MANISFSLQSSNAELHDKLVNRENAFSKLFEGLEYCLEKRYPCALCAVPTNENLKNGDFEKSSNMRWKKRFA